LGGAFEASSDIDTVNPGAAGASVHSNGNIGVQGNPTVTGNVSWAGTGPASGGNFGSRGQAPLARGHLAAIANDAHGVGCHIEAVVVHAERIFDFHAGFFNPEQAERNDCHQHGRPPAAMIAYGNWQREQVNQDQLLDHHDIHER
jgi:hypothetical protein